VCDDGGDTVGLLPGHGLEQQHGSSWDIQLPVGKVPHRVVSGDFNVRVLALPGLRRVLRACNSTYIVPDSCTIGNSDVNSNVVPNAQTHSGSDFDSNNVAHFIAYEEGGTADAAGTRKEGSACKEGSARKEGRTCKEGPASKACASRQRTSVQRARQRMLWQSKDEKTGLVQGSEDGLLPEAQ